jgi:hypothetical protein
MHVQIMYINPLFRNYVILTRMPNLSLTTASIKVPLSSHQSACAPCYIHNKRRKCFSLTTTKKKHQTFLINKDKMLSSGLCKQYQEKNYLFLYRKNAVDIPITSVPVVNSFCIPLSPPPHALPLQFNSKSCLVSCK